MKTGLLHWLLEPDDCGVRYLALRDLAGATETDLAPARENAHREGPIAAILEEMKPEGYWEKPGGSYLPKYTASVWSLILLGQLGASADSDPRIKKACTRYLDNAMTPNGQISMNGTPSQTIDCIHGNMLTAFMDLGYEDERLDKAWEWMARMVTGEGVAPMGDKSTPLRWYSGKCGPGFACGANNKLPCAWGAAKVMMAFGRLPKERQTPLIERAIEQGVEFLFSVDPATAAYPSGYAAKPSGNWWKFGFPVFYITDILQIAEALAGLGLAKEKRLANTLDLIESKQDSLGRWLLEYDYSGKTWVDFGPKKQPNKWVTLRALRVLKAAGRF